MDLFQKNEQIKQDREKAVQYLNLLLNIEIKELDQELQDGVLLCNLINQLKPGTIKQVGYKDLSFIKMDNIIRFLQGAQQLGLEKMDLFDTLDLFEGKKMEAAKERWSRPPKSPLRANDLCVIQRDTRAESKKTVVNPLHDSHLVYSKDGVSIHYQLGNCIGQGDGSAVYRALDLATGETVAIKRLQVEAKQREAILKEANVFKSLDHPNLIRFLGHVASEKYLYLILEYAENGSLLSTLSSFGAFPEKLVGSFALKLLQALDYLHEREMVHGHLKAANILTTKTGDVKLTDVCFPLASRPEVSIRFDVWCLGCTLVELMTGRAVVDTQVYPQTPCFPTQASETMRSFLSLCFEGVSTGALKRHAWLDDFRAEEEEGVNDESQVTLFNEEVDHQWIPSLTVTGCTGCQEPTQAMQCQVCLWIGHTTCSQGVVCEKNGLFRQLNAADLKSIEHYIQTLGLTAQEQKALAGNEALLSHALSLHRMEPVKSKGQKNRKKKTEECVIS
ncbi:kinase-like domain-containing protein [Sporodiniella umbellata]|nr:kinase-like domain-containing protein [Sporodiniella umbellata]